MRKFLDYITKDAKGQSQFAIVFGIMGTLVALTMTYVFWNNDNAFYQNIGPGLSVPVGFLCVYYLGIRKNIGNVLGFIANINETAINTVFGNFGFVMSAIYFGFSHVVGYIDWSNNTDETGTTAVRDIEKRKGLGTLLFFLALGTVFVLLNIHYQWIDADVKSPLFWANIVVMYLGIVAQGAMVLRYRYAWWIWFTLNIVAVPVQFISGNYVFAVMYLFYEINCILALYAQYTSSER